MSYFNSNDMMAFEATRGARGADDAFVDLSRLITVGGLHITLTADLFPVFSLRAAGPFSDTDLDTRTVRRLRYLLSIYGAQWLRDQTPMWFEVMTADPTGDRLDALLRSLYGGMLSNAGGSHYLAVLLKKLIDERVPQTLTGAIRADPRGTDQVGSFGTPGTLFQTPKTDRR